ncbi:hypothetical protein DHD08_03540 [Arenibacter sp. H213]|nr:hypothetical protein [Arenibacter sp. H213]
MIKLVRFIGLLLHLFFNPGKSTGVLPSDSNALAGGFITHLEQRFYYMQDIVFVGEGHAKIFVVIAK